MRWSASGIKQIEVGSFVNPKAVPQMADTNEVFDQLAKRPGIRYRALWLNPKGWSGRWRTAMSTWTAS